MSDENIFILKIILNIYFYLFIKFKKLIFTLYILYVLGRFWEIERCLKPTKQEK